MTAILPFSIESAASAMPGRTEAVAPADAAAFGASLEQALLAAAMAQPEAKPADQTSLAELARALFEFGGEDAAVEQGTEHAADCQMDGGEEIGTACSAGAPIAAKTVATIKADAAMTAELPAVMTGAGDAASAPGMTARPVETAAAAPTMKVTSLKAADDTTRISETDAAMTTASPAAPSVVQSEKSEAVARPAMPITSHADKVESRRAASMQADEASSDDEPIATARDGESLPVQQLPTTSDSQLAQQLAVAALAPTVPKAKAPVANATSKPTSDSIAHSDEPRSEIPDGVRARAAADDASAFLRRSAEATAAPVAVSGEQSAPHHAMTAARAEMPASMRESPEAASVDGAATDAAVAISSGGAPLPAGVRVLELQAEAARRRTITGAAKRDAKSQPAPRTTAQAGAELQAGTAMPTVAAEAIEQLRRPAIALVRDGVGRSAGNGRDGGLRLVPTAKAGEAESRPVLTLDTTEPTLPIAEAMNGNATGNGEPSLRQQAEQAFTGGAMPATAAGHAGPSVPVTASAPRPVLVEGTAPVVTPAPMELTRPGHERISVRLGDDVGSPVVRINIRGDQVNARIVTPDAQLAQDLGRGMQELATALEARGFESARVQVRGTGSAYEHIGPAQLAGSGIAESRSASETRNDDRHQAPEDRAQGWREAEAHERRQGRRQRRTYEDEEQP